MPGDTPGVEVGPVLRDSLLPDQRPDKSTSWPGNPGRTPLGNAMAASDIIASRRLSERDDRVLPVFWENSDIGSAFEKVDDSYRDDYGRVAMRSEPVQLMHVAGLTNRLHLRRAWLISATRKLRIHEERLVRAAELIGVQLVER